jgi:hypothetical protein
MRKENDPIFEGNPKGTPAQILELKSLINLVLSGQYSGLEFSADFLYISQFESLKRLFGFVEEVSGIEQNGFLKFELDICFRQIDGRNYPVQLEIFKSVANEIRESGSLKQLIYKREYGTSAIEPAELYTDEEGEIQYKERVDHSSSLILDETDSSEVRRHSDPRYLFHYFKIKLKPGKIVIGIGDVSDPENIVLLRLFCNAPQYVLNESCTLIGEFLSQYVAEILPVTPPENQTINVENSTMFFSSFIEFFLQLNNLTLLNLNKVVVKELSTETPLTSSIFNGNTNLQTKSEVLNEQKDIFPAPSFQDELVQIFEMGMREIENYAGKENIIFDPQINLNILSYEAFEAKLSPEDVRSILDAVLLRKKRALTESSDWTPITLRELLLGIAHYKR